MISKKSKDFFKIFYAKKRKVTVREKKTSKKVAIFGDYFASAAASSGTSCLTTTYSLPTATVYSVAL